MARVMKHDDVVIDIKAMVEEAVAPEADQCCIYRVPFDIRKLNNEAYTPRVVSIGPFHHNRHDHLRDMERHKLIFCKAFLQRTNTTLDTWIRYIQEYLEPHFRQCYSHALEFSKEELVKIIFVDSGFIFELFLIYYHHEWSHNNNNFVLKPWMRNKIEIDLLLLENQLPFSVLDRLFNLSFASTSGNDKIPSFLQLTLRFFTRFNISELNFDKHVSIKHFTDLIRTFHLVHHHEKLPDRNPNQVVTHLSSTTELSEAGVRFKVNSTKYLSDFAFTGGVLTIPQLIVQDSTEILFRNMIALEQCHYPLESYITDYVIVMDFLVNKSRDVDILVQERVVLNLLGENHSVAKLFNGLSKNIVLSNMSSHYGQLAQKLTAFQGNPWNKLKSTLRRDYGKTPWQSAVSIAGILLLVLSLLQTVCSVLQIIQQ